MYAQRDFVENLWRGKKGLPSKGECNRDFDQKLCSLDPVSFGQLPLVCRLLLDLSLRAPRLQRESCLASPRTNLIKAFYTCDSIDAPPCKLG